MTSTSKNSSLPSKYQSKELNQVVRYSHEECGDTRDRLYVQRTMKGWLYHCHNCAPAMSGFCKGDWYLSPSETVKLIGEVLNRTDRVKHEKVSASLPDDYEDEVPEGYQIWLNKYDITESEVNRYGIGYSSKHMRLVLPIYSRSGLVGWQGRGQNPKYTTFIGKGAKAVWFDSRYGKENTISYSNTDVLVLVEDIVSAIKVSRHARAIALLGSYVREELVLWLQQVKKVRPNVKILLWLDPDKYSESHRISARLRGLGLPVITVATDQDPKEESDATIKHYVS